MSKGVRISDEAYEYINNKRLAEGRFFHVTLDRELGIGEAPRGTIEPTKTRSATSTAAKPKIKGLLCKHNMILGMCGYASCKVKEGQE